MILKWKKNFKGKTKISSDSDKEKAKTKINGT